MQGTGAGTPECGVEKRGSTESVESAAQGQQGVGSDWLLNVCGLVVVNQCEKEFICQVALVELILFLALFFWQ
jgi:hypothetical protein